jgi:hypothetical protein
MLVAIHRRQCFEKGCMRFSFRRKRPLIWMRSVAFLDPRPCIHGARVAQYSLPRVVARAAVSDWTLRENGTRDSRRGPSRYKLGCACRAVANPSDPT